MKKILVATQNPGKVLEYREIFANLPFELVTLKELGIKAEPEEDGKTFEENAITKAEFYSKLTDLPLLAEDSGLEIDYLNGEPGVLSRRWLGRESTDQELVEKALNDLRGVPKEKRGAQLRVVIAFKANQDAEIITSGWALRGHITEKPEAEIIPGYPFRSIFYVPDIGKVLGSLTMEQEAMVAHRKRALEKLIPEIKKLLY